MGCRLGYVGLHSEAQQVAGCGHRASKVVMWSTTCHALTMHLLCTCYVLTMYLLCTYYVRPHLEGLHVAYHLLCTYYVLTMYSLCTHYVLTMYSLCTTLSTHYVLTMYLPRRRRRWRGHRRPGRQDMPRGAAPWRPPLASSTGGRSRLDHSK